MTWLSSIRYWIGIEPSLPDDLSHPAVTSPEERRRIDAQIEETKRALDALLAKASLDWQRDTDDTDE